MKLNKKYAALVLAAFTTTATFAKTKVVTTIFPEYDWVLNIAGEKINEIDITLLLDNGVDLHSYQPSVKDIAKISTADIFIYVGGESDDWVKDVLRTSHNKKLKTINLLETLGERVKEEEIVEGMQLEDEDEEETEYDEHVWLSLRNTQILCSTICEALCSVNPTNALTYKANLTSYNARLSALDAEYTKACKDAKFNTLLFGDRFPLRYLTDDYGLKYYAAFAGCSAETEASFKTIAFLSSKVDELGLKSVCKIESGDGKIARTIIQSSKAKDASIVTFNSMQAVTKSDIKKGATYLGTMQSNLEALKKALGSN